jgi:hypothetical protein
MARPEMQKRTHMAEDPPGNRQPRTAGPRLHAITPQSNPTPSAIPLHKSPGATELATELRPNSQEGLPANRGCLVFYCVHDGDTGTW